MSQNIQYITNEAGAEVGVLLDLDTYRQLTLQKQEDEELLINLSQDELVALAETSLSPATQSRLDELLQNNQIAQLSKPEQQELDELLVKIDSLNLLKTRARYTLTKMNTKTL